MAELDTDDVEAFTRGRLSADSDETARLLAAALAAARRYCGWSVCPVVADDEIVVDGPGGRVLSLPTMQLLDVSEVVECGTALDVTKLDISRTAGTVEKYPYGCWTSRKGGIAVTMTHGYTEDQAADWRNGVLRLVDLMSLQASSQRDSPDLIRKRIDDVEYQWANSVIAADDNLGALFGSYAVLQSP